MWNAGIYTGKYMPVIYPANWNMPNVWKDDTKKEKWAYGVSEELYLMGIFRKL